MRDRPRPVSRATRRFRPFPPFPRVPPLRPPLSISPASHLSRSLLRKPLSAYNNAGLPKSAFKTPKLDSDARDRRVSFFAGAPPPSTAPATRHRVSLLGGPDAADDADANPKTPGQTRPSAPRVSHRRAGMRTRKGTGRSVAARTFSLVLRAAAPPVDDECGADEEGGADGSVGAAAAATLGSRDGASGVAGRSEGASGSVDGEAPGGSGASVGTDAARAVGEPGVDAAANLGVFAANANANAGEDDGTIEIDVNPDEDGMMSLVPYRSSREPPLADVGFDDDDGGFGGGFDEYDGDDWAGATPAPDRGALVDGFNDPMTGGLDVAGGKSARDAPRAPDDRRGRRTSSSARAWRSENPSPPSAPGPGTTSRTRTAFPSVDPRGNVPAPWNTGAARRNDTSACTRAFPRWRS